MEMEKMSTIKKWQIRFSCLALAIPFLLGACLNPVSFNEDDLPRIRVEIEGSIKINDVAVMWLINRTKSVDVTSFTITRPKLTGETEAEYTYPQVYANKPLKGNSLATYHAPLETPYDITVDWVDNGVPGTWTKSVQFPRPADYKFYLYRTAANKVVVIDEAEMKQVPDPDDTTPGGPSDLSGSGAQTFVVINVTPDQNLDEVEFVKDADHFVISQEPKAKDQKMILLGTGSFVTTARYTRDGAPKATVAKNIVVTKEDGSMAVRTNFVYFYKTKAGDYQLSQTWPPIPDDASDENKPEDALLEGQGMLRIVNKAVPGQAHSVIARVKIGDAEYPDAANTAYMVPGDIRSYILDAGTVQVAFKALNQNTYGINIPREIHSRRITTLEYIGEFANPDIIPPDAGFGAGLIRIINNSYGLVSSATVFDYNNVTKSVIYGYEDFNPPQMINYGQIGRVSVIGTAEFPLNTGGAQQLVQVDLDTEAGTVTIQRPASINNTIVDIVITQEDLEKYKRVGSKVIVQNQTTTPTLITQIEVYNKANPSVSAVYNLNVSSSSEQSVYVLSGTNFPIMSSDNYAAYITVCASNGNSVTRPKEFTPLTTLYSTTPDTSLRYLTLVQDDIPSEWVFTPIHNNGITTSPSTLTASTTYTTNSGSSISVRGRLDFNAVSLTFNPANASKTSPVIWSPANPAVTITDNMLTVESVCVSVPSNQQATGSVTVTATIPGGGTGGADYTQNFIVSLPYSDATVPSSDPVTLISLATPPPIAVGQALSLPPLVTFNPAGAHIDGTPITTANLNWDIISGTGASISGGTFTAATPGTYTVQATLQASFNNGTAKTATTTVTVTHPATLTLRIILSNKKDSVKQIAIVPANRGNVTYNVAPGNTLYSNGYTGEQWAVGGSDPTYTTSNRFANRWPGAIYKTVDIPKGVGNYRDVTIPWPAEGGFYLFFLEGDNRARGYCYPGNKTAPTRAENYLFYIRPEALTPIWLDSGHVERVPGTAESVPVIPISYHTDNNVSSIMWSQGIGNQPGYRVTF
jgi:hypothetical protein